MNHPNVPLTAQVVLFYKYAYPPTIIDTSDDYNIDSATGTEQEVRICHRKYGTGYSYYLVVVSTGTTGELLLDVAQRRN